MPMFYNADMDEKNIAKLESQLEHLVEGAFTHLFRKKVSAHDIAVTLARSMENSLRYLQDSDARPLAPDTYTIQLHPSVKEKLEQNNPLLSDKLGQHIVELVIQSNYRLAIEPVVEIVEKATLDLDEVEVEAKHTTSTSSQTQAMQPIATPTKQIPKNPQLVINNGERTITLTEPLLNIGRSDDNHIVLDDAYCSRHHIQLRLRFGAYTLFDVNSRTGTSVNNVRVTEHQLQSGDVIRIGGTQLTYITQDDNPSAANTTQSLEPITF